MAIHSNILAWRTPWTEEPGGLQSMRLSCKGLDTTEWLSPSPLHNHRLTVGFAGGSDHEEFACSAGDLGLIPGLGRSPGEGNGYPLQYSRLEKSMKRGAWQATVHGVPKSQRRLSN